jgi:catechol 2,3-dioxygenase-like lactoylglutathione lyase family enzyme
MTALDGARLFHVNVNCRRLARSRPFYEAFGLTASVQTAPEKPQPGGGEAHVLLVYVREPGPQVAPARRANTVGIWRAAFLVPDIDAAWTGLESVDDAARLSPPVTMAMGKGLPELRFGCFRGPDGEVLELIEEPV